jgi:large subunit ribosomal protein L15
MVVRKRKKVRKFRGHRTYGYGSHKKHRGGGSRGGRGLAGLHKHKWSYTVKYLPEHFGKRGFKRPSEVVKKIKTINLKELDQLVEKLLEQKLAVKEGDKIKINLEKIGYDKLLGEGKLTKPLIVEAKFFSKLAIKKLEESGGKAIKIE